MGRIVVMNRVTLDGVMQAPGRPVEDTRGGFTLGGWGWRSTTAGNAAGNWRVTVPPSDAIHYGHFYGH